MPQQTDGPLTPSEALDEIAALMRIEHPWGPFLRRDVQAVLARVSAPAPDLTVEQITTVLDGLPPEPVPLTDAALSAWRTVRSEAVTDIARIVQEARP